MSLFHTQVRVGMWSLAPHDDSIELNIKLQILPNAHVRGLVFLWYFATLSKRSSQAEILFESFGLEDIAHAMNHREEHNMLVPNIR